MTESQAPLLHLVAGPNGAGKSTFYARHIAPSFNSPWINADDIAQVMFGAEASARSLEAAALAATTRTALITQRASFATETVFSHPSKLALIEEARDAGYYVALHVILLATPELSAARVDYRIQHQGHRVPVERIAPRFHRNLPLLRHAVTRAHVADVYDNSDALAPFRLMLRFEGGRAIHSAALTPIAERFLRLVPIVTE